MHRYIDVSSLAVAIVTLLLFMAALFTKGIGHDLFLETGVFLVSIKLILMMHKNRLQVEETQKRQDRILEILERLAVDRERTKQ